MRLTYNRRLALYLLLATLLVLALCLWCRFYVQSAAAELEQGLAGLDSLILAADWTQAEQRLAAELALWQKKRAVWQGLMNHQDVMNVDLAFASLQAYLLRQQTEDTLNQLAIVRYYLAQTAANERLTWPNFF